MCLAMENIEQKTLSKFIRLVCKGKSEEELKQAEANYLRFIQLADRINKRLEREKNLKNSRT